MLRGGEVVLSAVLPERVASSFARIACTTLCGETEDPLRQCHRLSCHYEGNKTACKYCLTK